MAHRFNERANINKTPLPVWLAVAKLVPMAELLTFESLLAFTALTALEVVLGVDNLVFIAILTGRLPEEKRAFARQLGLTAAAAGRIILLLAMSWVIMLDKSTLFSVGEWEITLRDLILIAGGLFLLAKATWEIHHNLEGEVQHAHEGGSIKSVSVSGVLGQILLLDLVFSIDSVLTAVGMVQPDKPGKFTAAPLPFTDVPWTAMTIMSGAVLVAVAVMIWFINPVSAFIERHPTVKMLALAFLLLIGMILVAEGLGRHIPRGYVYFAMGFSIFVEFLNLKASARRAAKRAA
jgi:predicted tellurium resistance membrane protein TerC